MSAAGPAASHARGFLPCAAVVAAFLGVGALGAWHHEPWRDEIEIWLIARGSANPLELLHNMRTEGHPALWYFVSFLVSRLSRDPFALQLANLAIGAAAVGVFFRSAPFGLAVRLQFAFGYFALFEFSLIARSYALELLLLFTYCAHATRGEGRIDPRGALLLVLLAHTNLYGTMMALALASADGLSLLLAWRRGERAAFVHRLLPSAAVGLGATLAFLHVYVQARAVSPAHGGYYPARYDLAWLLEGVATVTRGTLPFPSPAAKHVWNSSFLDLLPAPWDPLLPALGAVILVLAAAAVLRPRPRVLASFALGLAPMLILTLFVYFGSLRHHGQPFLWFLACTWLAGGLVPGGERARGVRRLFEPALALVLAVQAIAGAWLYAADQRLPFSSAKAAGLWLAQPENREAILVGSVDYAVQPIAGWMERPIYYPEQRRFGTYVDWGDGRVLVSPNAAVEAAVALVRSEKRPVLLVLDAPPARLLAAPEVELRRDVHARLVARFEGAIVADENYAVFLLDDPARR